MNGPEIYYATMNILDYMALNILTDKEKDELYNILDALRKFDSHIGDEDDYIASIADANNCGICSTWEQIVDELRKQFNEGERI